MHIIMTLLNAYNHFFELYKIYGAILLVCVGCLLGISMIKVIKKLANSRMAGIAMTIDSTTAQPGQELEVTVGLTPRRNFRVRRAVVQLVRVENCIDEGSGNSVYHERKFQKVVAEEVLFEGQKLQAMPRVDTVVKFVVPLDAVPTVQGRGINLFVRKMATGVSWWIKVKCDVHGKFDLSKKQEIVIHKPPSIDVLPQHPGSAVFYHSVGTLTLSLLSANACSHGSLEGVLKAAMHTDISVSRVMVALERYEAFGEIGVSEDIAESVLSQKDKLQDGQTYEWPFRLEVGDIKIPSMSTDKSTVEYRVTGKLDIARRRDPSVSKTVDLVI